MPILSVIRLFSFIVVGLWKHLDYLKNIVQIYALYKYKCGR